MMKTNGWFNGIFASLLLTLPVGSVYAFSLFAPSMAEACNVSLKMIQYAFSLSIFFLGMGAAFFGPIVEKNPSKAGYLAATLYAAGMGSVAAGLKLGSYPLVLVGYGVLNGLGQGIAYLAPVKALILWFPKHKGLAAAVSIVSFGLGSTFCTWLAKSLSGTLSLCQFFGFLAVLYCLMMDAGSWLLKKPDVQQTDVVAQKFSYISLFKDKMFWHCWLFMFLNISAGLALIGCSASIFKDAGISKEMILVLLMLAGVFNGGFRLIYAWMSDFLKFRIDAWLLLTVLSIAVMCIAGFHYAWIGIAVLLINSNYGGGFSCCPSILADYYDSSQLSRTHGAVLSAWGFAGLIGNNVSMLVFDATNSFYWLIWLLAIVYLINMINLLFARKKFTLNMKNK